MSDTHEGIIFSDVDGTFVDASYRPVVDADTWNRVRARWRIVWASSRTGAELLHLQRAIGHENDAIGENGGVLVTRDERLARSLGSTERADGAWLVRLASPYAETLALVRGVFDGIGLAVRTLEDLGANELAARSGYTVEDAQRALERRASVVLADLDPADPRVTDAATRLRARGCAVAHGGRWISVVHGADKGSTARAWLARAYESAAAGTIVAIGDSDNDESLLRIADMPFVIRPPGGSHAARLARVPGARLLERAGTLGWLEMFDALSAEPERAP